MALPPIESLRHRLAAATDDEVHQLVEECRQEVLTHLKQQLKERLLHTLLEEATQRLGLDPSVSDAPEPGAEAPPAPEVERPDEIVEAETLADEPFEIREAYQASTSIDVTPPAEDLGDEPTTAQPAADEPASDEAEGWSYGDSSGPDAPAIPEPDEDEEEGSNAHIDEDILREIEAIRQQISKNEQLLSQLKPFFTESDDA